MPTSDRYNAPRRPALRRAGTVLIGFGAFLLLSALVTTLGGSDHGGLLILNRIRFAPGYLSLGLASVATGFLLRRRTVVRIAASLLTLGVGACGLLAIATLVAVFGDDGGTPSKEQREAAPAGRHATRVVTTYFLDATVEVRVEQRRGLVSRTWQVGCNEDDTTVARWVADDRLVLDSSSGSTVVRVDPTSGRPVGPRPDSLFACNF